MGADAQRAPANSRHDIYSVLLIDDDDMDREYFSSLLANSDEYHFKQESASSLKEALSIIEKKQHVFDCILVDYSLGDGTGEDLLRAVSQKQDMPAVIVFTSFSDPQKAIKLLELGAHDYLDKRTINKEMLTRVVRFGVARSHLMRAQGKLMNEQRVSRVQHDFIHVLSDELQKPISSIRNTTEKIRTEAAAEILPFEPHINTIDSSVNAMDGMIARAKECTLFDPNNVQLNLAPFNIHHFLLKMSQELGLRHPEKPLKLICNLPAVPNVIADKKLCCKALENVLENAFKYSPDHSLVTIRFGVSEGVMSIQVRDKGRGIPFDELQHLGNKFFRTSNSSDIPGAGMGLYFTRHIMELMHGKFDIQSEKGLGTVVSLSLPIAVLN